MVRTKKYSINFRDVVHGFVTAFFTASVVGVEQLLASGSMPTLSDLRIQLLIGLSGGIGYLVKKFLTNSEGKIIAKEPKNKLQ